jgi:hypothetical protein
MVLNTIMMLLSGSWFVVGQRVGEALKMEEEEKANNNKWATTSMSNTWTVPAYCGSETKKWSITPLPEEFAHKMTPLQIVVRETLHAFDTKSGLSLP